MSVFKLQKELCPVCGLDRVLYGAPFHFAPDLLVCPDCIDAIWHKSGCGHWEEGCCDCPLWTDGYGDDSCQRKPFPLKLIGYDPNVVYERPRQLNLFGEERRLK